MAAVSVHKFRLQQGRHGVRVGDGYTMVTDISIPVKNGLAILYKSGRYYQNANYYQKWSLAGARLER